MKIIIRSNLIALRVHNLLENSNCEALCIGFIFLSWCPVRVSGIQGFVNCSLQYIPKQRLGDSRPWQCNCIELSLVCEVLILGVQLTVARMTLQQKYCLGTIAITCKQQDNFWVAENVLLCGEHNHVSNWQQFTYIQIDFPTK